MLKKKNVLPSFAASEGEGGGRIETPQQVCI